MGCLPQAAWPERLLSKSQDAVALQQIKERGALPMIDRGDIRQAIDRCSNIWASLPGAGYGQFEHKADSLIAKIQRSGRNGQRDWCMSRVTAIISALVILHHRLLWAVNHYRDNAITYKAQRDKNAEELKLANAAITDMQMRQLAMLLRSMQNLHEELADAKAEGNDALRDDVAAGRRRLHIKAVCQSVREAATASGVDNAASPDWQTPLNEMTTPSRERLITMQSNWKEPRSMCEQCR